MRLCRRIVTEGGMTMRDYEQSRQQFVAGKIGIIASSPNAARAFTDLVGSKFKLGCQIYPRMNKDHGRLPTGGNGGMILTKDPIKQRAAWEYLKFACGPEGQKIAVLGSGYMPTNKLAEKPEYLGDFYKKIRSGTRRSNKFLLRWDGKDIPATTDSAFGRSSGTSLAS